MEQNKAPLFEAVTEYIKTKPAYFRIPGHRLDRGISSRWTKQVGTEIFSYDVTETPYTDDLHNPEGAIKEAQELLAELYGAQRSFFLVNGTTCGNEAMIISSAFEGQKIMVARNAHKSAMMGMIISGARPVYIMPEVLTEWGLQGGITPYQVRKCFEENPDCKALFLVSPTYYGICSDLKAIAKVCHEYGAMLLVDEAHGGHLYFNSRLPEGALKQGADMCVQSMHKVTGALTQSSVLHVCSALAEKERVAANLQIVQSTSPSYLLMTSLDLARYEFALYGKEMTEEASRLADYAREEIRKLPGFLCMGQEVVEKTGIAAVDTTRLVISAKTLGITGYALEEMLFQEFAVDMELADYENVLAVVTCSNTREDMERLIMACKRISQRYPCKKQEKAKEKNRTFPKLPRQVLSPRQAYFAEWEEIAWEKAKGRISAEMIAPYPPGIPVIYPGEELEEEVWEYLEVFRRDNHHLHGPADTKLTKIRVIKCV